MLILNSTNQPWKWLTTSKSSLKGEKVMGKFYFKGLMLVLQYSEPNADLNELIIHRVHRDE